MNTIFVLLFLLVLFMLIAGLISPKFMARITKTKVVESRKRIGLGFGVATFILLILIGVTSPSDNSKVASKMETKPTLSPTTNPTPSVSPLPISSTDKAKVVTILSENTQHYVDLLNQGKQALGGFQYTDPYVAISALNDPTSPAAKYSSYNKIVNPCSDMSMIKAFNQADSYYNADNEPTAMGDWRDDMGQVTTDICVWSNKAVDWQVKGISNDQFNTYEQKFKDDIAVAQADIATIKNSK